MIGHATLAAMASPSELSDRCPRCGAAFHCGAQDSAPCPCAGLSLPAPLQAALRQRWQGCLCLACLRALAAGEALEPPA